MLPPRIPMNRIGKMTVKASESGLLTARRISRQAIAKTALVSRASVAPRLPETAPARGPDGRRGLGYAQFGAHATASSSGVRRSST